MSGEKLSQSSSNGVSAPAAQTTYVDLDKKRRAALAEIDNASFSFFHVKICLVAGVGFFTDAYDIFTINIASLMLGYVYGPPDPGGLGVLTSNQDLAVKVATPVGTLIGQLLFGWLADVVGRKRMYGVELMIIIISTLAQALSGQAPAIHIIDVLFLWRLILGIGIGSDFPLSAVISSKFASTRIRGRMMTATFSAQGFGQFAAALVSLIVVVAYKSTILFSQPTPTPVTPVAIDYCWRLLIGLECVPACVALYFRLTIPETPRFTLDIERNMKQAIKDVDGNWKGVQTGPNNSLVTHKVNVPKASWADFRQHFGQWKNGKVLFGAAWSWFVLDIAFYGFGLNNASILSTIGFGMSSANLTGPRQIYTNLWNISVGNVILSVAGLIPGYWVSFIFIDSWGRKPIQLLGFIILTVLFICMGFGYDKLIASRAGKKAFVFLYCLTNFFQNFGPNTTTFVIPGEVFPTRYRSTAHGISAASGKLGAVVAQVVFNTLANIGGPNKFLGHILEIVAFFMLTGIFSIPLIPGTKGKTLEELSGEDQDGFVRGELTE